MKKYVLIGLIFLSSCSEEANLENKSIVKKEYRLNFNGCSVVVNEYEIDGCQYIGRISGRTDANYLTHKGNCTNAIHSSK